MYERCPVELLTSNSTVDQFWTVCILWQIRIHYSTCYWNQKIWSIHHFNLIKRSLWDHFFSLSSLLSKASTPFSPLCSAALWKQLMKWKKSHPNNSLTFTLVLMSFLWTISNVVVIQSSLSRTGVVSLWLEWSAAHALGTEDVLAHQIASSYSG